MNLWKDLPAGAEVPKLINMIVEIPMGSRNKYEFDNETGTIRLDRVLYSSMYYPGDYGLIPQSLADDGDPMDILAMVTLPTFPGCVMQVRPIGLFRMKDRDEPDDKILAVPINDPLFRDYHDIADIPQHFLEETAHFFAVYKDLEGVHVKTFGWEGAARAEERVLRATEQFKGQFGAAKG